MKRGSMMTASVRWCRVMACGMWVLFCLAAASARAQSPTYTVTDLGILPGGNFSYATSINNNGQVVGLATNAVGQIRAFLWQNGTMTDLGTLGGDSRAFDINDAGDIVGTSADAGGSPRVFLYHNGAMQDVVPSGGLGLEIGINNSGQIVGQLPNAHGFLYTNGTVLDLGTFGGSTSQALAINDSGEVVGYGYLPSMIPHAFILSNGVMRDLGALTGAADGSGAYAVNRSGDAVGSFGPYSVSAALWRHESNGDYTFLNLGVLPGAVSAVATDINDSGTIVGGGFYSNGDQHGFVYDSATGMRDLNDLISAGSGWLLHAAGGINNAGQIIGPGVINGQTHGYLLTPLYSVCPLYDQTKAVKSGATIPIKLQVCNSAGANLSSSSLVVHATGVTQVSNAAPGTLQDAGNANPDFDFRYDATLGGTGGYIFNLKTTGLSTGTYQLNFVIGGGTTTYSVQFCVR